MGCVYAGGVRRSHFNILPSVHFIFIHSLSLSFPPHSFPLYKGQFVLFFFFENLMFDSMFLDCFLKQPLKNEWFKNG